MKECGCIVPWILVERPETRVYVPEKITPPRVSTSF